MIVAVLDLNDEFWKLARLAVALLQPALVLALIVGFVLVSSHLLTMIATRWGNRRTTSKSLWFSFGVHLLLACGLIILIPEYRPIRFPTQNERTEMGEEPIRIVSIDVPRFDAAAIAREGVPRALKIERPVENVPRDRLSAPRTFAVEIPRLEKPMDHRPLEPMLTPDSQVFPAPVTPAPEIESVVQRDIPFSADAPLSADAAPVVKPSPPVLPTSIPERERASLQSMEVALDPAPAAPGRPTEIETGPSATTIPDRPVVDSESPLPEPVVETEVLPERLAPDPLLASPSSSTDERSRPMVSNVSGNVERNRIRSSSRLMEPDSVRRRPSADPSVTSGTGVIQTQRPVPESLVMPERVERPALASREGSWGTGGDPILNPSAYRLRSLEERESAIRKFGGSPETEAAVDRSLKWLASVQRPEGRWDASDHGARQMGTDAGGVGRTDLKRESHADTGVTALAVLAFLGKLHTVDQGEYSENVNRALRWIISQQRPRDWGAGLGTTEGYLGGTASDFEGMYCHGMATFALGEAYALSCDNPDAQWLREPLEKAVGFIADTQVRDGGWRYLKGHPYGDMSMFGWMVMALKSAEAAGINVPEATKTRMQEFLYESRLGEFNGLAAYRRHEGPSAPMTAEALYCRQMLGLAEDPDANREAVGYLLDHQPTRTQMNLYYWYYGTLAMYQHGGPEWDRWNAAVRDVLVSEQRRSGPLTGSWDPRDVWGVYGGRIYSTAIATLNLEVYYRYLPLYRLHEPSDRTD